MNNEGTIAMGNEEAFSQEEIESIIKLFIKPDKSFCFEVIDQRRELKISGSDATIEILTTAKQNGLAVTAVKEEENRCLFIYLRKR
ncbi:MAG: hypothetical protein JXB50_16965 [Spirochaetes bacterium]|nr:hypothetical protein [Spirochaetota bacterium]